MLSRVTFSLALLLALVAPSLAQDIHLTDRITATFNQSQAVAQHKKAATDVPDRVFQPFIKVDPEAPVYIEADSLIEDSDGKAVFSRVELRQGDFVLRTNKLTAFYLGRSGLRRGDELKAEQLTRVEAKGWVIITSKKDRRVIAQWATFDVTANTVLLWGGVSAERGEGPRNFDVATGERLKMDLTTGMLRFEIDGAPAEPVWR